MNFTFDPFKRAKVLTERGLDILDMRRLFDGRFVYEFPSPQRNEDRLTRIGEVNGKLYAVIWMERDGTARLITTRRARIAEEREFARRYAELRPSLSPAPGGNIPKQVDPIERERNDDVDGQG